MCERWLWRRIRVAESDGYPSRMVRKVLKRVRQKQIPWSRCLLDVPPGGVVVDVGCANGSPQRFSRVRSDIRYLGTDLEGNSAAINLPAGFHVSLFPPESYLGDLATAVGSERADLIVVKHVLEHLADPNAMVRVCASLLSPGGVLYLSFPSTRSLTLPSAVGTLNFHDDPTHVAVPSVEAIRGTLVAEGLQITLCRDPYRPVVFRPIGFLLLHAQRMRRILTGSPLRASALLWAGVGFESMLVAKRPLQS